jgi:molecular chaperone DnaK
MRPRRLRRAVTRARHDRRDLPSRRCPNEIGTEIAGTGQTGQILFPVTRPAYPDLVWVGVRWLRTLRYWLAGGRRRWFARQRARLPAAPHALAEVVEVGLDVDPEGALAVVRGVEARLAAAPLDEILARATRLATGPAWSIGWILTRQRGFGLGLALHHARRDEVDALVLHLDDCRERGVLDRELFAEVRGAIDSSAPAWRLCQSYCFEHLGDLREALAVCDIEDRRLRLVDRLRDDALALRDPSEAMRALVELRELLAREAAPSPSLLERRGGIERHRVELLAATRVKLRADLGTREAVLAAAAFEELAGERAEAALLLERTGELADRMHASRLWEADERYGDAVRSLGPLSERAEVKARLAELRESGGDAAGAAALFEHLGRWRDARRAFEAAGQPAAAARCFVAEHGAVEAARSVEYARLVIEAGRVDELVQRYVERLAVEPDDRPVLDRLRVVMRAHGTAIEAPRLREAAEARLAGAGAETDRLREAFDRGVAGWITRARAEVAARYGAIWGMDLGTSKSAACVFDLQRGTAVVCPHRGDATFASTLAIDKAGNELVGLTALEQLRPDLRGCIEGSKRTMGRRTVYRIGDRQYSPEEVAARLLAHGRGLVEQFLRDQAEQRVLELARAELQESCEPSWLEPSATALAFAMPEVVVTIPAYFNFDQRRATRDAAEIAGLQVRRLVPEPTAACLFAALTRQLAGRLMVIDLGAGTLDLSYLEASRERGEGFFEVEQIFGDTALGSRDFDAAIEAQLLAELGGVKLESLDRRRLRAAAEQLKIALSTSPIARDELVAFAGKSRHTLELSATRLEQLLEPLLARLEATCRQAAALAHDHLVLVGGPMFSPIVRARIERVFGRKADLVVDPRTTVAMGAACQGAVISNHTQVPFLLLDIVPFALGVLARGERDKPETDAVVFQIPRGTRIPHESTRPYSTLEDNQPAVDVQVFHGLGDSPAPAANRRLAMLHLDGIPPAKAGEPEIDVTFAIDRNGVLEVTAIDKQTGTSRSLRIDATWLSPAERGDMAKRLSDSQRLARERQAAHAILRQIAALAEKLADLERRDAAGTWRRHFERLQQLPPVALERDDELAVAAMYNTGALTSDRMLLAIDRARALCARVSRLGDAPAREETEALAAQLGEALEASERLDQQFRDWSACLVRATAARIPAGERFAMHHEAGDWPRALAAYAEAYPEAPPPDAVLRRLDALARSGNRASYLEVLDAHRSDLGLPPLQLDRLNELARQVSPAIAWVFDAGAAAGTGFLVAPNLVVTSRHVVGDPARIAVQVGATQHVVAGVRFPVEADLDLAVLELAEAAVARPLRLGYTGLVEIGERVVAMGFPLPEGSSFDENLLIDHGIVNRIRARAQRRELELGLGLAPGMSGGPVFNDRGEVIAISTFVRIAAGARSSHAIAVDALHELVPRPWQLATEEPRRSAAS